MGFEYICFNITEKCNMACPYCYRINTGNDTVDFYKAKRYIDYLINLGCKAISITGGEPLLNTDWREIIKYSKEKGLFVILSTNGLLLDLNDSVLNYINVLSVPLDGASESINRKTRAVGHFDIVKNLIYTYISKDYTFKLRINTVVTHDNIKHLYEIKELLNDSRITWKLFECRKKGVNNRYPSSGIPSIDEMVHIITELKNSEHVCKIIYMGRGKTGLGNLAVKPNYIILHSNGDLFFSTEDSDIKIFNIDGVIDEKIEADNKLMQLYDLNNQYLEDA